MYKKRQFKKRNFKKRWYVNASATLPFIGRTKLALGNKKRSIISMVRNGLEEPLHKLWNGVTQTLLHETIYTMNLTGNIAQGTSDNQRTGDTIHLEALKYRIWILKTNGVVTNVNTPKKYRILLVKSDAALAGGSDTFSGAMTSSQLFQQPTTYNGLGIINPKVCTVLLDQTISINPVLTTQSQFAEVTGILPLKCTHVYKTGTNYGKNCNYYLNVMGFEPGGVSGTTNIGSITVQGDLIFKDSR